MALLQTRGLCRAAFAEAGLLGLSTRVLWLQHGTCEQCWPRTLAGDAPVCHQPSLLDQGRYRLLRGGQEQLPLVNLFCAFISLFLAVSCHWLPAMALSPSPVPSLHAQPVPTSLPAAGPTFPPQLAAAPYCGNYYLLWIFSVHYVSRVQYCLNHSVPLCGQKHTAIHSCSTSLFTRLSRRERRRGKA